MLPSPSRIVITGIGLVTPFGLDRETSWRGLQQGAGAMRKVPELADEFPPEFSFANASVAVGAPYPRGGNLIGTARHDPVVAIAARAAAEAVADAGLVFDPSNSRRVGCVLGTSKGGLRSFATQLRARRAPTDGLSAAEERLLWDEFQPYAAASFIARQYGLGGAAMCPVAACATGLLSIARGAELIRDGHCDAVLAGSSDASLQAIVLASFRRLGVLAKDFSDPATACRPFDRHRNGFLIGEGGAVVVLEREEHALARGKRPHATWLGARTASDSGHLTSLADEPHSLIRLITDVLRDANVAPDEIDYVNLHGTATLQNDLCETRALRGSLGTAAGRVACSSLKGTIGHLLGAAGSAELAATLLAMRDGVIPPTANLQEHDDACDLDYTPLVSRQKRIETALKLSLGFGGHLVAAVVRAWR